WTAPSIVRLPRPQLTTWRQGPRRLRGCPRNMLKHAHHASPVLKRLYRRPSFAGLIMQTNQCATHFGHLQKTPRNEAVDFALVGLSIGCSIHQQHTKKKDQIEHRKHE